MKKIHVLIAMLVAVIGVFASCSKSDKSTGSTKPMGPTRSFYLGFTPFPYDEGAAAQNFVYNKIGTDGDIICHHFDNGIPWPEALHGDPFNINVQADWLNRLSRIPAGHKLLVTVTPINIDRDSLAPYKGDTPDMPLPPPWDTYTFNDDSVKIAYANYCNRVIDYFSPDYFVFGIEVNLLIEADTTLGKWNDYLELQQYTYTALKAAHPNLPVFVSFTGMDLIENFTEAHHALQAAGFQQAIQYSDYLGLSFHPIISVFQADSLPVFAINEVLALSSTKPVAITETSYPADTFSVYGGTVEFDGTPAKQEQFFTDLLAACDDHDVRFAINFVVRDYDSLWVKLGSPDDLSKLWRDTGFWDADGNERPVLQIWRSWLSRPIRSL